MNILLDNIAFELQKAGGVSLIWKSLLEYFQKSAIPFSVIEGPHASSNLFRKQLTLEKTSMISDRPLPVQLRRFCTAPIPMSSNYDIYHASYFRQPKDTSIKQVVTVHDMIYQLSETNPLKRLIHCHQQKQAIKAASHIICVSQYTKNDLLKIYPWAGEKPITIIHNGASESFFPITKPLSHLEINGHYLEKNSFMLFVSSRLYNKNFPLAIKLLTSNLAKGQRIKLVCVGGGPFTKEEKSLFCRHNLQQDQIIHLGRLEDSTLNKLYNLAHCLLLPSLFEGFGIPAVEAMRAGCIVLPAKATCIPEVMGHSPFFYDPFSLKEAEKALELSLDPTVYEQERLRGLTRSKLFTWEQCAKKTIGVYKSLM